MPAKDLKVLKLKDGDFIKITIEPILSEKTLTQEYSEFKKQYGKTLKKLAK